MDVDGPRELPPGEVVYLSYHIFEHYSSVRNLEGPHTGLAFVREVSEMEKSNEESLLGVCSDVILLT